MIKIYTAVPGTWVVTYTYHVEKGRTATSSFQVSDRVNEWDAIATVQVVKGHLPGFKVKRVEPSMVWQRVTEAEVVAKVSKFNPSHLIGSQDTEGEGGE